MLYIDYSHYLTDPMVYAALERKILECFLALISNADEWTVPYFKTTFSNGKPFQDGNPIFSARYKNLVIRVVIENDRNEITAILQEKPEFEELVIVTDTDHIEEITVKIKQWSALSLYINGA